MSDDDPIKAAEKRGYSRGYAAGKVRRMKGIEADRMAREREAFRRRAFLSALPACIQAAGWERPLPDGTKQKIVNMNERVRLAWDFAEEALKRW